jgi:hypothetical protein
MIVWHYYEPVGWEPCESAGPYGPHDELPHVVTYFKKPSIRPRADDGLVDKRTLRVLGVS